MSGLADEVRNLCDVDSDPRLNKEAGTWRRDPSCCDADPLIGVAARNAGRWYNGEVAKVIKYGIVCVLPVVPYLI